MAKKKENKKTGIIPVIIKKHSDKNGGHHHVIMGNIDNKHVSVGLTTKETKGKNSAHKNYRCEINPLGGKEISYLRKQGTVDNKSRYNKEKRGAMAPKDYAKAKEIADKAKNKYINKKNSKKK